MNLVALACACGAALWLTGILAGALGFSALPALSGMATPSASGVHHARHHHRTTRRGGERPLEQSRHALLAGVGARPAAQATHRLGAVRILVSGPAAPPYRALRS